MTATTHKSTKPEKPKAERKPRQPKALNEYEIAARAFRSLTELDALVAKRGAAFNEALRDRKQLIDGLSPEVRALLKLDEPKAVV
jgi:hypothetical protein